MLPKKARGGERDRNGKMPFSRFTYQTRTNKKKIDANTDEKKYAQTHTLTQIQAKSEFLRL